MSDGDIIVLRVAHPDKLDNTQRGYFLTSLSLNRASPPAKPGEWTTRQLQYETVRDLLVSVDQPLVIDDPLFRAPNGQPLRTIGTVTEMASYAISDMKGYSADLSQYPPEQCSTIMADFRSQLALITP